MLTVVHDANEANANAGGGGRSLLDEIVRDGARQMLAAALQAEVAAYIDAHADEVDQSGRRLVVRNGSPPRAGGIDRCGCGDGDRTTGQRSQGRP